MRIKEWYSWHFPELKDIVKDNYLYARVDIMNAGRASMGQELNEKDLVSVNLFADK